jgi:hypothetical protein
MDYDKNIILVSYVSGSFGSALVNLLTGSPDCYSNFKMFDPNKNHWHCQEWLFDAKNYNGGFITEDTVIEIPQMPTDTNKFVVGQFHNMNSITLRKHFPNAKIVMLSIDQSQFNYALHRWWKVIGFDEKQIFNNRIAQISAAYDVITYNTDYYDKTKIITKNDKNVLTIKFDDIINRITDLEQFLGITLNSEQVEIYKTFIQKHLGTFFQVDDNFMFAWQAIDRIGRAAPIIDLANTFKNTHELKKYLDEQK